MRPRSGCRGGPGGGSSLVLNRFIEVHAHAALPVDFDGAFLSLVVLVIDVSTRGDRGVQIRHESGPDEGMPCSYAHLRSSQVSHSGSQLPGPTGYSRGARACAILASSSGVSSRRGLISPPL